MTGLLPFAAISQMWYALPLIVVVSLVYAATRHELMQPILHHAVRWAFWITGFMAVIFAIFFFIDRRFL